MYFTKKAVDAYMSIQRQTEINYNMEHFHIFFLLQICSSLPLFVILMNARALISGHTSKTPWYFTAICWSICQVKSSNSGEDFF